MVRGLQDQPQHCDLAVDRLDSVQSAALVRLSDGQLAANCSHTQEQNASR
jgi:hypothetical protein